MVNVEQLKALKAELPKFIEGSRAGPIIIRYAWHDAGTYDKVAASVLWYFVSSGLAIWNILCLIPDLR